MCRDLGDGIVASAGAHVVSSLLPQPGQRAADVALPDRSDLHQGLLSEPVCHLGRGRGRYVWLSKVVAGSLIQPRDCEGGQLLSGQGA
jgi:hypothetical protein